MPAVVKWIKSPTHVHKNSQLYRILEILSSDTVSGSRVKKKEKEKFTDHTVHTPRC